MMTSEEIEAQFGGPMNPTEYRAACKKLNISVYRSAKWLDISLRTAQRYSQGETSIPERIAVLLRIMIRHGAIEVSACCVCCVPMLQIKITPWNGITEVFWPCASGRRKNWCPSSRGLRRRFGLYTDFCGTPVR